jgi:pimeloyl-ACP methyl ester carboxylesterase
VAGGIAAVGREHRVAVGDGRELKVLERGDSGGRPVLAHGGSPNSRLISEPNARLAERQGIRLISYDRPGYGGSTPQPGRTVADCAKDVRAVAAALGIERLAVWGISGGGPHALACAALLPDLVPAVAVLACPAPWGAEGLDYFAGMGEQSVEDVRLFLEDRAAFRAKGELDRLEYMEASAQQLHEVMKTVLSPVDAAVLTTEFAQHLVNVIRSGLAPGAEGWWEDEVAFMEPWGFELKSIRTPVLLYHGRHDRFVPFAHGEWLAGQIPGVQAKLSDDDGHLTLVSRHLERIHAWLLERL